MNPRQKFTVEYRVLQRSVTARRVLSGTLTFLPERHQ
jgi:hypothetical protein